MADLPTSVDARLAFAEALSKHPDFTLPDPLVRCDRCGQHAALYGPSEDAGYICGICAPRVSLFALPMHPTDLRVIAADAALEDQERE